MYLFSSDNGMAKKENLQQSVLAVAEVVSKGQLKPGAEAQPYFCFKRVRGGPTGTTARGNESPLFQAGVPASLFVLESHI